MLVVSQLLRRQYQSTKPTAETEIRDFRSLPSSLLSLFPMPISKRKAGDGGRRDGGKLRKKGEHSSSNGSKGGGGDRKTGPRLPQAVIKQIEFMSSKKDYDEDDVVSDDGGLNDLYEDVPQKPQEELQKNRRFDPVEKIKIGLADDFEDEDIPSDDEMVNGIVVGKDNDSDDEEDDEERHARMLNRVTNMPTTVFKGERKKHDVIIPEVHPESEYNPTRDVLEGDDAITLEDLLGGFGKKSEYSKVRNSIKNAK